MNKKFLSILLLLNLFTFPAFSGTDKALVYNSSNGRNKVINTDGTSGQALVTDGAGNINWATVASSADITSVGDVTSGAAFDGTQGTILTGLNSLTLLGGTTTTSDLNLKTTSGVGTTGADMHFLVGNNGATEAMTILDSGYVGIATTNPATALDVAGSITTTGGINVRTSTITTSATPTPNADTTDIYTVTALTETATFGQPTGTNIINGQRLCIRIYSAAAQTLAWNAIYVNRGVTLPTLTIAGKYLRCLFEYNSQTSTWDFCSIRQES